MKKFFVALLVLAAVAGNLFAEVSFSGGFLGTWDVVAGESGKTRDYDTTATGGNITGVKDIDSKWLTNSLGASSSLIRTRLHVTAANEEGTWGGWFRIQPSDTAGAASIGFVWWQPISQIKVTLGLIDGFRPFGRLAYVAAPDYLGSSWYGYADGDIFPAYDAAQGVSLLITPIANLKIGISAPIQGTAKVEFPADSGNKYAQPAEYSFRRTAGWVNYTVEGVGDFALGFKGSATPYTNGTDYGKYHLADAKSQINLGVNVTAIENLTINFGAAYPISQKVKEDTYLTAEITKLAGKSQAASFTPAGKDITLQNPISIALGVSYTTPDVFGVNVNAGVSLGGKTTIQDVDDSFERGLVIGAALEPWVNVGFGKIGLFFSVKSTGADKAGDQSFYNDTLALDVTPYFAKVYGGGAFYVGVRIGYTSYLSDVEKPVKIDGAAAKTTWAIPISVSYDF